MLRSSLKPHTLAAGIILLLLTSCAYHAAGPQQDETPAMASPTVSGLETLFLLSDAESRSISPENLSGGKGMGDRTELADGSAKKQASQLGKGWKVNPYIVVQPGETLVMGEAEGPGLINHIWMTDRKSVV